MFNCWVRGQQASNWHWASAGWCPALWSACLTPASGDDLTCPSAEPLLSSSETPKNFLTSLFNVIIFLNLLILKHTHTHTCLQTHTHAHTRMHTHIKERTFCSLAQESPLLLLHYLWHNKQRKQREKSPSFWKWVRLVDLSRLSHSVLCKNAPAVCFKKNHRAQGQFVGINSLTPYWFCKLLSPFSFLLMLYKICNFCTWSLLIRMLTTRSLSKRELLTFVWINFLKRMSQETCSPFVSVSWHPWNLILFTVVIPLCPGEPKGCLVVQCQVLLASVIYLWGTIVLALPKAISEYSHPEYHPDMTLCSQHDVQIQVLTH